MLAIDISVWICNLWYLQFLSEFIFQILAGALEQLQLQQLEACSCGATTLLSTPIHEIQKIFTNSSTIISPQNLKELDSSFTSLEKKMRHQEFNSTHQLDSSTNSKKNFEKCCEDVTCPALRLRVCMKRTQELVQQVCQHTAPPRRQLDCRLLVAITNYCWSLLPIASPSGLSTVYSA